MVKKCRYGEPDIADACYRGWIIGRKLIDFDGKLKPFAFYPRKEHGRPPYWYKTKEEAKRAFDWQKKREKFPGNQSNSVVVKFTKEVYLNRY